MDFPEPIKRYRRAITRAAEACLGLLCVHVGVLFGVVPAIAQLNENCTVSVVNRTAQVKPDGTWVLPNVPANIGQVRARATCIEDGTTRSGQSDFFTIPPNGTIDVPAILLGVLDPIPASLTVSAPSTTLSSQGATVQLAVTANFPGGTTTDVTPGTAGTNYTVSNPAIATVSPDGLVTAVSSGTVLLSAMNEGALGLLQIQVVLSGDSDGDGIPDDVELANGLNPNNPVDALEDFDNDGLTNKEELIDFGTDIQVTDTDGDGISDGEEVIAGADGFVTSPLLVDTDGDGIRDALEIATGSDPTDASSFNLAQALGSLEVAPSAFDLNFNTLLGEASRQLTVTGNLTDGTTIDLTSTAKGTNYTSSDLTICSFGAESGRVFAGMDGTCTITASNSGFSDTASGTVQTFAPTPLSFVAIPGFANNVDVSGDFAYVAAGAAGLQVVGVSNRAAPTIVGSADTPGNANDVKVVGNTAFIADGSAGLQILDITNPLTPQIIGAVDTPGDAQDVVVRGNLAFVAAGATGLQVIDISDPTAPSLIGSVDTPGVAKGVDVDQDSLIAVVADGASGLRVVDITDAANPTIIGSIDTGDARDVVLGKDFAFVADRVSSFTAVEISDPSNAVVRASTPRTTGGLLFDVALAGRFAFGADIFFVNGVPIIDVSVPEVPTPLAILDFRNFRDDDGTGIAADGEFVYLTASRGIRENGAVGDTRLYIGQYLALEDTAGIPPLVNITSPRPGETVIEGSTLSVAVDATDDVTVVAVDFLVDGQVVFTDTTGPYQFSFTVPVGVNSLALGAIAVDLGGNTGVAQDVVVTVVPDPLTTVVGSVVDTFGIPIDGATVETIAGLSATTGPDGTFTIEQVPTTSGQIRVSAFATIDAASGCGESEIVVPVRGGLTDVGAIVVVSPASGAVFFDDFNGGASTGIVRGVTFTSTTAVFGSPADGIEYASALFPIQGTMEVVIRIDQVGSATLNSSFILDTRGADGRFIGDMVLFVSPTGILRFTLAERSANPGFLVKVISTTSILDGRFHAIAVSYGSDGVALFVDGVLEDTNPFTGLRASFPVSLGDFTDRQFSDNTFQFGFVGEVAAIRTSNVQSDVILSICHAGSGSAPIP